MAKVSPAQTSFLGGEWSPLLYGRVEAERYPTALKTCLNYVPLVQGPLTRRSGTKFVAPTKTAGSKIARLRRFKFSTIQAYQLEFSDLKMRVYMNRAAVLEASQAITNITQASPAVVTYSGADNYANGDEVEISGVVGMTQVNGRRFTVANVNVGAKTFELQGVNSTGYGAYVSGGTVSEVFTLTTPYLEADLFKLKFVQSADVLYIAHPGYAPRKLARTGHTAWTLSVIDFKDGPYLPLNTTATTITPSAITGSGITLTASVALFVSTDVGRLVRIRHSSTWGYAKIVSFTSATVVAADVKSDFGAITASAFWRLGLWSDTTGYPGTVSFVEDRLIWGGSKSATQRIDASKSGDYENMAPTATDGVVAADNAISYTLNSSDVQTIKWTAETDAGTVIGTESAEWILRPSSQNEALTPTNVKVVPSTYNGSADVQAVVAGDSVIYVQTSGRKVREIAYLLTADKFKSPDLTVLAEHITASGVKQLTYQKEPQPIIWGVRNDGVLLGCTYERDTDGNIRAGWHRHIPGGFSTAGGAAAQVISADTLPSPDGSEDDVWVVVKRFINGQTAHYVEFISEFFDKETAQKDAFFVDCGVSYDGAPASTFGGLWHLEGQTVSVLADGAPVPDKVVSNGTITLTTAASTVAAGYSFNSDGQVLRVEAGAADGVALGKTRRTHRCAFLFQRTLGWLFGTNFNELDPLEFRSGGDPMDQPVPLFTGVKSEIIEANYDFENEIAWRQNQPLPGTLLAIMPQMHTQDR